MSLRIFSGIQPTGVPHLGNYFGALKQWMQAANERKVFIPQHIDIADFGLAHSAHSANNTTRIYDCDTPIYSIVDIHAYSAPNSIFGQQLYNNILSTTASLLALGLEPNKCILFRQSDILEHAYLQNVLDNFVSTGRLARMIQYKEKVAMHKKGTSNALLNYPVLQAADILMYKTHLVPVGSDQSQHVELTRDIVDNFRAITGSDNVFVKPQALLPRLHQASRLMSLRNPSKKMSKSDADARSFIEITDKPDVIVDKIRKAMTDSVSSVYYDPESRPAVSNLMQLHHLITGESIDQITDRNKNLDTGEYKLKLADLVIAAFNPIRTVYERIRPDVAYLEQVLQKGSELARPIAYKTVAEIKHLLGSFRQQ